MGTSQKDLADQKARFIQVMERLNEIVYLASKSPALYLIAEAELDKLARKLKAMWILEMNGTNASPQNRTSRVIQDPLRIDPSKINDCPGVQDPSGRFRTHCIRSNAIGCKCQAANGGSTSRNGKALYNLSY